MTEERHPLLQYAFDLHDKKPLGQFLGSLSLSLRSAKFLYKQKGMWPTMVAPAIINIVLFTITTGTLLWYSSDLMALVWAQPAEWYWSILWWIVRVLLIFVTVAMSYVATMLVGMIIASPFLTKVSEETERIMTGKETKGLEGFWNNARGAATAAVAAIIYLSCIVVLAPLNLIPFIGSVAATILGGIVSGFIISFEYTDYVLDRRLYRFKDKVRINREHKPLALGFGVGTSILLWVPFLNFFCMPLAVVGGTCLAISMDELKDENDSQQESDKQAAKPEQIAPSDDLAIEIDKLVNESVPVVKDT